MNPLIITVVLTAGLMLTSAAHAQQFKLASPEIKQNGMIAEELKSRARAGVCHVSSPISPATARRA